MSTAAIQQMLERLGVAISTGNMAEVSASYAFPALFLSDEAAMILADAAQIEGLLVGATEWYRAHDLVSTRPELEHLEEMSEKLVAVDVRWPAFDASGTEKWSERSHYLLQAGPDGQPRIRVALTRTR